MVTDMSRVQRSGIKRIIRAAGYSYQGILAAWKHEAAFQQELVSALFMVPIAFWLGETAEQQILLIGSCMLVIIVELLNSAIEAVVDRIGPGEHNLSGRAKDMGSAAVLISLLLVVLSWTLIIRHRFFL
jgi:diacylglycerol kinase (ATP)